MTKRVDERVRMILQHRLQSIRERHNLPRLSRAQMLKLVDHCQQVIGECGLTDNELRMLHKLTSRGLFD